MRLAISCSMSASVFFCQANRASAAASAMLAQYSSRRSASVCGGSAVVRASRRGRRPSGAAHRLPAAASHSICGRATGRGRRCLAAAGLGFGRAGVSGGPRDLAAGAAGDHDRGPACPGHAPSMLAATAHGASATTPPRSSAAQRRPSPMRPVCDVAGPAIIAPPGLPAGRRPT